MVKAPNDKRPFSTFAPLELSSGDDFDPETILLSPRLKSKRKLARKDKGKGIAEPRDGEDQDSDDDFNALSYTPPPKPSRGRGRGRGKGRSTGIARSGPYQRVRPRTKRSGSFSFAKGDSGRPKPAPLLDLLGLTLDDYPVDGKKGAVSESSEEAESSDDQAEPQSADMGSTDEDQRKRKSSFGVPPAKRVKVEAETKAEDVVLRAPSPAEIASETELEESVTETESEPDIPIPLPSKTQPKPDEDDSHTETESEADEIPLPPKAPRPSTGPPAFSSGSQHLSSQKGPPEQMLVPSANLRGSDNDERKYAVRPNFVPTREQTRIGPLVLDAGKGIQVPASINRFLRDYQRDGVQFFWKGFNEGKGRLLGDDMGLGKTIQVISFLAAIMKRTGDSRDDQKRRNRVRKLQRKLENDRLPLANSESPTCLIVTPLSLVDNWARELETWGYFEVGRYTSSLTSSERSDVLKDFKLGRLDIVLTSHECARNEIDALYDLPWSCIFVDEAHKLKNPKSKTTEAMHEFRRGMRFGLTGTAVQNDYEEFWTLLDWTNPKALGSLNAWKYYVSNPLRLGQSSSSTVAEQERARRVKTALVDKLLPRFFLRRTKDLIKHQLPTKTDNVVFCNLTERQIRVYKLFLDHPDVQIIVHSKDKCDCDSGMTRGQCCHRLLSDGQPWNYGVLKFMTLLIKLSNHVALIYPSDFDNPEQMVRNKGFARYIAEAFPEEEAEWQAPRVKYAPDLCGKWDVLSTFLARWKKEGTNKVLIFSKSVKLLDIVDTFIQTAGYDFCRLDGKVPADRRMEEVDKFNNDPDCFIFLISTLAGGTGLNLTSANKVVIFDPNWNPAHDLQAMDRAYRIGQNRDVTVYRLLGSGSLEELIYARQLYKQAQMRIAYEGSDQRRYWSGVQGAKVKQGELFGIKNIFTLHETGLVVKSTIEKRVLEDFCWILENVQADMDTGLGDMEDPEAGNQRALKFLDEEDPALPPAGEGPSQGSSSGPSTKRKVRKSTRDDDYLATHKIHKHVNDDVLANSSIEAQRLRAQKARHEKTVKTVKPARMAPTDMSWVPKRPPKPQTKMEERLEAARKLGFTSVETASDILAKSPEEQRRFIGMLDAFVEEAKGKREAASS